MKKSCSRPSLQGEEVGSSCGLCLPPLESFGRGSRRAFTLLEILVAATIFSVVALAMGLFMVGVTSRTAEGERIVELERDAHMLVESLRRTFIEAMEIHIPADISGAGPESFTAIFWPEPFMDENRNGVWDSIGASGPCSPMECFEDLNGDGIWSPELRPPVSFWKDAVGRLLVSEGGGGLASQYFDPEKGYRLEEFSVSGDKSTWVVRFTLVAPSSSLTPGGGNDLKKTVQFSLPRRAT